MAADDDRRLPRYGVAGWPVSHSLSPQMHRAAYEQLGVNAIYQRLPLPPDLFAETVRALPGSGFRGINVTIPHKQAALAVADGADAAASAIGAANTLTFTAAGIEAINTDAPALVAALGTDLSATNALVLGAGGTARAATWALLDSGAAVTVWNRTASRAAELAAQFECAAAVDLPETLAAWDLVVNCTSVGMADCDESPLRVEQLAQVATVVDFVVGSGPTLLARLAAEAGCRTIEGRELLARQGSLSFAHWFGVEPPLEPMLAALG